MSCVPYVWQYCWKEISAVAYIFYLVHCVLRHEITLHVLCRDKYSTSMQQFCHPGNNSYKQETIQFSGLYAHQRRQAQSNVKSRAFFFSFFCSFFFFLLRFGTSSNHGGILLPNPQDFSGISAKSPPQPDHAPLRGPVAQWPGDLVSKPSEQTSQVPQYARKGLEGCSLQYLCCILLRKPYSSDIPRIDRLIRLDKHTRALTDTHTDTKGRTELRTTDIKQAAIQRLLTPLNPLTLLGHSFRLNTHIPNILLLL